MRQMMAQWKRAIVFLMLVWSAPAWAHTIILRNGQVVYGEVIQQDRENVYVATGGGRQAFAKSSVLQILFQEIRESEAIKRIIRAEVARKQSVNSAGEIRIVDYKQYLKEVAVEEEHRRRDEARSGALWRSALLPGWGQWHEGQKVKGGLLGGLFLAAVGARVGFYEQNRRAVQDYEDVTLPFLSYSLLPLDQDIAVRWAHYTSIKQRMQTTHNNAGRASVAMALVWAAAMVDAALFRPEAGPIVSGAPKPRLDFVFTPLAVRGDSLASHQQEAGLSLTLAF